VFTDEGIIGYGEASRLAPGAVCKLIEDELKPLLLNENPMAVERLWDMRYGLTFRYGRKGIVLHAISGVEIALWDIIGKYRNLPIYEMLGGLCQDKIKAYASLIQYQKPEEVVVAALNCVEQGYSTVKLHQRDIESVKAVRRAVGADVTLMVDVNGAWHPRQAVAAARAMADYGVLWLEEPVTPVDDYDGLAYVRDHCDILIAAGENEYTHYGFKEMMVKQAVDIVQPDAIKSGGILACRKIFALAEAWNLQIATHSFCYGPGMAATLHLSLSNMKSEYVEVNPLPIEESFIQPVLKPEKGYLTVTGKPGLGIEIDEAVVKKYRKLVPEI
jgi:L-alanine-DL-glutamate epimerase-like enolase superfamily enzyme